MVHTPPKAENESGRGTQQPTPSLRVIVRARSHHLSRAWDITFRELSEFRKYTKIGWGWHFGSDPSFFVRRLKDGLSCTTIYRDGEAAKREPSSTSDDSVRGNV